MKKRIYVQCEVPGFHQWFNAPKEVEFLKHSHRHIFNFMLVVNVERDDREVEFFLLKRELEAAVTTLGKRTTLGFDYAGKSCEQLAVALFEYFCHEGYSVHAVIANEDGENGALIEE